MPGIFKDLQFNLLCASFFIGLFLACGSGTGGGGGVSGSGGSSIQVVIENPNDAISGSSKNLSKSLDVGKAALSRVNPTTCTLTISADDMTTVTKTFTYASTASVSVDLTTGSNRTFNVDCADPSNATNNIPVGFEGSTTADLGSGATTITLSPSFKNLISDDASGIEFLRINQENSTQTLVTFAFGSALTDAQKAAMRCVLEFDASGSRTSLGVIDASQSSGLKSGTKSDSHMVVTGGVGSPSCFVNNTSGSKALRATGSWATNDDGNSEARCKFGITQTKNVVDSNQKGQIAAACSLTGSTPYDSIPDSGYGRYDLSANSVASDVSGLTASGESCTPSSRGGETCESGWCLPDGTCGSLDRPVQSDGNLTADFQVGGGSVAAGVEFSVLYYYGNTLVGSDTIAWQATDITDVPLFSAGTISNYKSAPGVGAGISPRGTMSLTTVANGGGASRDEIVTKTYTPSVTQWDGVKFQLRAQYSGGALVSQLSSLVPMRTTYTSGSITLSFRMLGTGAQNLEYGGIVTCCSGGFDAQVQTPKLDLPSDE